MNPVRDLKTLISDPLARRAAADTIVRRASRAFSRTRKRPTEADTAFSILKPRYSEVIEEMAARFDYRRLIRKPLPDTLIERHADWIERCVASTLDHCFDLGGESWVRYSARIAPPGALGTRVGVRTVRYAGADGERLSVGSSCSVDPRNRLPGPSEGYEPIPWHTDPLTGFYWDCFREYSSSELNPASGADVRVAWEIARMQHLPLLAIAHSSAPAELRRRLVREFVDQVIDFHYSTPPPYGIHWASGLEAGIRTANIVLALCLFSASGAKFDSQDLEAVFGCVLDHLKFCVENPDRRSFLTHNHYLVQLCGTVIGTAIIDDEITEEVFNSSSTRQDAAEELCREICEQFHPDGSNFEGSTGYHLFVSQAAAYGLAVLRSNLPETPGLKDALDRIGAAGEFLDAVTSDSGRIPMIGDFDGSRLFLIERKCEPERSFIWDRLYSPPVICSIAEVSGFRPRYNEESSDSLDAALMRSIIGGREVESIKAGRGFRDGVRTKHPRNRDRDRGDESSFLLAVGKEWDRSKTCSRRLWLFGEDGAKAFFGAGHISDIPGVTSSDFIGVFLEGDGDLVLHAFSDFGLYIYRGPDIFAAIRCGPVGQRGWAGHSHSDQLSMTLEMGGNSYLQDPGTLTYGGFPRLRRAYRSSRAHNGPYSSGVESLPQGRSLFGAPGGFGGVCLLASKEVFVGSWGDGRNYFRRMVLFSRNRKARKMLVSLCATGRPDPIESSLSDGKRATWSVAVLDWSSGAPLAEHSLLPAARAYARIAWRDESAHFSNSR